VDEAHFPGEPGCVLLGTACSPTDDWATDLPTDRPVYYVRAGAPGGGTGTRDAPFRTIATAAAWAASGSVIAVAKGTYDEEIYVPAGVTLWGACVAETLLLASTWSETAGTLNASSTEAVVRNLRIGGERSAVRLGSGVSLRLEDAAVDGAVAVGLWVSGTGQLFVHSVAVRNIRPLSGPGGSFGRGLNVEYGGRAEVSRTVFERSAELGLLATDAGTVLLVEDAAVFETIGPQGHGLGVGGGARAELSRTSIEGAGEFGVYARESGTRAVLTDVVIRDTRPGGGAQGSGLIVGMGASAVVLRALIERNVFSGVWAQDPVTSITMEDVVVRDSLRFLPEPPEPPTADLAGWGISVQSANVELSRGLIERNLVAGIFVNGSATTTLADVWIRDTECDEPTGAGGRGALVSYGGRLDAARVVFDRNTDAGILAEAGGTLSVADIVIRDTRTRPADGLGGSGFVVRDGSVATIDRVLLEGNVMAAGLVDGPTSRLTLNDAVIRDTLGLPGDGSFGYGLGVQFGAAATVTRVFLDGNRGVGAFARDRLTELTLVDAVVRDTAVLDCATTTCAGRALGLGLVAVGGAHVGAGRFLVTGSALAGLQLALEADDAGAWSCYLGTMDLHHGEISNGAIGANIQAVGFDVARLTDGVTFAGNAADFDEAALPVPDRVAAW
jgi:hypothetical protein